MLGGVRVPLVPVQHQYAYTAPLPELAGETREVVHPILRHQDHSMYFRQHADAYGIGNYRHEPRLTEPEDIRPPGGDDAAVDVPVHRRRLRDRGARDGVAAARRRPRRADAHVQRPDVLHARRLPAAGRDRVGPRALARRGDLGHPLGRRGQGARRAHDPRRRVRRPPRGRPRALRQPRPQPAVRARPRRAGLPRGLRHHPPAPAVRAGPRPAPDAVLRARGGPRGAFFESAGWERPQWYEANAALLGDDGGYEPSSEWAAREWSPDRGRRAPRLPRAGRALRRLAVHEVSRSAARAPRPTCSAWRRTTSTARSARSSTRRCSARGPGSCAT